MLLFHAVEVSTDDTVVSYTFINKFYFVEAMFIKVSETKNPLKITCYTVSLQALLDCFGNDLENNA